MVQTLFYVYILRQEKSNNNKTIPNITGSLPNQVLLMISTSNHSINLVLKAIFYQTKSTQMIFDYVKRKIFNYVYFTM